MTRADELHDAFDRGFAAPLRPPESAHSDFLCIQIGSEPLALQLTDIASLHADLRIVALPTRAPELLGMAAIRAAIVPIYDLGVTLGLPPAVAVRWLVVARGGTAGFAFERFDGHTRLLDRATALATIGGHVRGQLTVDGQPRSIVDLGSVVAAIETRWRPRGAAKEP